MSELYSQGTNSADGHDSADAGSGTDRPSRPVDEKGQESWAEDAEPLTRGEYADQVRQQRSAREHDGTADRDQSQDQSHDQAASGNSQEQEDFPEPRTRQEVADEARNPDAAVPHRDQGADVGLDADHPRKEQLPEPRTRQEVAEEARSGTAPLTHAGEAAPQHEQDTGEWPSPEERAQLHETYLDWRNKIATGPDHGTAEDQRTNLVGNKPDKSPGDRRDLPPTGEELIDMESDSASRFDRLRGHVYKEADDITDVAEKAGNRALQLFDHPPTETHTEVPSGHPEITNPTPPTVEGGQLVLAGLMVGMLGYELGRTVKNRVDAWRGR
jgi:hypothetical protein